MAAKTPLRSVQPDEKAPAKPPKSVVEAAAGGDRRELLVSLRARIAKAIEDPKTHPRDISPLSRRLQEIAQDIGAIDASSQGDDIGEAAGTPDAAFDAAAL